ncbi:MAG: hypothetical protein AAGA85_02595 [Bacteroidota bacterium]
MDHINFPFKTSLGLQNIIGYWELQQYSGNKTMAENAKRLIEQIDQHPILREDIQDVTKLDGLEDLVGVIMSAVVPPAISSDEHVAIFLPFSFDYFFATAPFEAMISEAGSLKNMAAKDFTEAEMASMKAVSAYQAILEQFYSINMPNTKKMVLSIDGEAGLEQHFELSFDPRFCEIRLLGELPVLSQEDINDIVRNPDDLEQWQRLLPADLFEFNGFVMYHFQEATHDEIMRRVKERLMVDDLDKSDLYEFLTSQFRSLVGVSDLEIGLSSFHTFKGDYELCGSGSHSLFAEEREEFLKTFHELSNDVLKPGSGIIIPDTSTSQYFGPDKPTEYKSVIVAPLYSEEVYIGHIELASRTKSMGAVEYAKVAELLPLFANSLIKRMGALENTIQGIIKEHYTSIHPAVEWKFTQAAHKILDQQFEGKVDIQEEIVFHDVYPLYGSSDIRNSSVERNNAIRSDLIEQLGQAKTVLQYAKSKVDLPIVGETVYRINKQLARLKKGLLSGDESQMINFIQNEIEPMISDLERDVQDFSAYSKEHYWSYLDKEIGIVYHKRKDFEESVMAMNDLVSSYLEEEEVKAQEIFPHYFEKYKTDGVEYNAYVGDEISRKKRFSQLYLKNLRLWQLLVTVEIARKTHELKEELPMPLEVGHLILVHSQPLSVRFRMDEKQFDVDGAYNIRYEIVKKRIDKVHIKGTSERLTQANTVSIVYTHEEDAREYLAYLEYLKHQGHIEPHFEQFELEELQGVSGLKAFRVRVDKASKGLIKELEKMKVSKPLAS